MNDSNAPTPSESSSGAKLLMFGIAFALLYIGGWKLAWGTYLPSSDALYMSDNGLCVRFNGQFYGIIIVTRFFASPVISWLCFFGAWSVLFQGWLTGSDDEDSESCAK